MGTIAVAEAHCTTFGLDAFDHILQQYGTEVSLLHAHTMIPHIDLVTVKHFPSLSIYT